ncbi:hypothetical protein E2562_023007 [Oryza meyeriana var. granulata]|uniref:Uncharacterized protein n=1 Tax=Oryza meyeriana var. granulata TaxID=110450 RepID=A0A6G1EYD8_9ORYZ|nr:hypothetical protein E2562_023007 [Oryza meyeriana var. granulata]
MWQSLGSSSAWKVLATSFDANLSDLKEAEEEWFMMVAIKLIWSKGTTLAACYANGERGETPEPGRRCGGGVDGGSSGDSQRKGFAAELGGRSGKGGGSPWAEQRRHEQKIPAGGGVGGNRNSGTRRTEQRSQGLADRGRKRWQQFPAGGGVKSRLVEQRRASVGRGVGL